ncbi:LPS assembly lipoprotein LptE [Roseobacter sp. EG26]|uniref:LPS assembly lipoprotein LptE n=1 Tax=Roseobacter sp. EG26 TaxID=3412477 RepID=UPI003CE45D3C
MSLFRRISILLASLALAACGFAPVYGTGGTGTKLQNQVEVSEPDTLNGYLLTRRIEERLGRSGDPSYKLDVAVRTRQENLAVDTEGSITRYNILGYADFSLINAKSGGVVASGSVDNFTGYSAAGTTVATLAAERDAQKRLMVLLADQITTRVLSTDVP